MTPEQLLATKANQNDAFNPFFAYERFLDEENDPFKALANYERYERQVRSQKSA
ncbi:MAG: hypothetical protein AAF849_00710 [Bacteroidota bacterium]